MFWGDWEGALNVVYNNNLDSIAYPGHHFHPTHSVGMGYNLNRPRCPHTQNLGDLCGARLRHLSAFPLGSHFAHILTADFRGFGASNPREW